MSVYITENTIKYLKYGSDNKVQNGIIRNLQRYKCKECLCNYAVEKTSHRFSDDYKFF